jgi:hypothetical protein
MPSYGLAFGDPASMAEVGAAEHEALRSLYRQQTGSDLAAQPDKKEALTSSGLLGGVGGFRGGVTKGRAVDRLKVKPNPIFASAMDALDALNAGVKDFVDKNPASESPLFNPTKSPASPIGQALSVVDALKALNKGVEKVNPVVAPVVNNLLGVPIAQKAVEVAGNAPGIPTPRIPLSINTANAGRSFVGDMPVGELATPSVDDVRKTNASLRKRTVKQNVGAAARLGSQAVVEGTEGVAGVVSKLPSPVQPLSGLKIQSSSTGQLGAPTTPTLTLGDVNAQAEDMAANPNQYVDASPVDKSPLPGMPKQVSEKVNQISEAIRNGATLAEADQMWTDTGLTGLPPMTNTSMRNRAKENGWDDAQWKKLSFADKLYRSNTNNDFLRVTLRSAVRAVGMAGSTPAGVKAVVEAAALSMGGDTKQAEQVIQSALGPYATFKDQNERLGTWTALQTFASQNPQEFLIAVNAAGRLGSVGAGAALRSGLAGERAAAYAARGQNVVARGATEGSLRDIVQTQPQEVPIPVRGGKFGRAVALRERERANLEYRAIEEVVNRPVELSVGYTGRGILGTIVLKHIKKKIADSNRFGANYRKSLYARQAGRGGRYAGNIAQGIEAEIQNALVRGLGVVPDEMTRQRYAFSLVWPKIGLSEGKTGKPIEITPGYLRDYFLGQIDDLEKKIDASEAEAEAFNVARNKSKRIGDAKPKINRREQQAQLEKWRSQARFFNELDKIVVKQEVVDRLREIAKPLGKQNDEIIARVIGVTTDEAKRRNYIRLTAMDPAFEAGAQALKVATNVTGKAEFIMAQRAVRRISERIQLRLTDDGYRKFTKDGKENGFYSRAESLRQYAKDRDELLVALATAERRAREYGQDVLAEQYGVARKNIQESGGYAADIRMRNVRDQLDAVAGLYVRDVEALPEAARAPYEAAVAADVAYREAQSAAQVALEATGKKRVDSRMIGLIEQNIEITKRNIKSQEDMGIPDPQRYENLKNYLRIETRILDGYNAAREAQQALAPLAVNRKAAIAQAKKVIRDNSPVLDSDGVTAAVDATAGLASVRVVRAKELGYYSIAQARGEVLDDFIRRVEANDAGAVLHLMQRAEFENMGTPIRVTGGNVVEATATTRVTKGRFIESKGNLFVTGQEASGRMWQQLLSDTAELRSAEAWKAHIEKTVDAVSVVVRFKEGMLQAAKAEAERDVANGADPEKAVGEAINRQIDLLGIEYSNEWKVVNLRSPAAKKPGERVSVGVVPDYAPESIAEILYRALNERTIDPEAPGDYYLMPRAAYDALQKAIENESFRFEPGSKLARVDDVVRAWRNVQLNVLPRTGFNNIVGSIILAIQAGAGPRSFFYAARALADPKSRVGMLLGSDGKSFPIPPELRQRYYDQVTSRVGSGRTDGRGNRGIDLENLPGPANEVVTGLEYGLAGVSWWMNNMRRFNGLSEDFGRLAVWYSKAYPAAMREAGSGNFMLSAKRLNNDAIGFLEKMASGDPRWAVDHQKWMQQSFDFLGDLHRGGALQSKLRIAFPFWQWYMHMLKLTLFTMPVKYPGRALFLQMLGRIGDEYQKEHGVLAPYLASLVPFYSTNQPINGQPQWVTSAIDTSAWYPEATVAPLGQGQGEWGVGAIGFAQEAVTPGITNLGLLVGSLASAANGGSALELDEQGFIRAAKDEYGNPIGFDSEMLHYIAHLTYLSFPLAPTVVDTVGRASTSYPGRVRDKAPTDRLQLGKQHYDLWSRINDPLANLPGFVLKLTTGVKLWTETPGPGPITYQRNVRDYEFIADTRNREDDRVRRLLMGLHKSE